MSNTVKGYKVFNPDWTCNRKQYTCPGEFEEDVDLKVCKRGMHFCKKLLSCFKYYDFDPKNKVAEVIAYGNVITEGDKSCTNKLEIVRELSWAEVLNMVNSGVGNTGINNTGNRNTGNRNTGDYNTGGCNTGDHNTGSWNAGDHNTGKYNTGNCNTGNYNIGGCNTGSCNTGNYNIGDWNNGNRNTGHCNTGSCNTGNCNAGGWNAGDHNTGDYNLASWSTGCFNTREQKIYMFDKLTDWTSFDWTRSDAYGVLLHIPQMDWVPLKNMTAAQKNKHPESETTGGYFEMASNTDRQKWWNKLTDEEKGIIKALPNFDPEIFKKITGIDVEEKK